MFHTYVTTSCGNRVDIDRASFLMDKTLFSQAIFRAQFERECNAEIPEDESCIAQLTWGWYCDFHQKKYHEPFLPDIQRDWDK